MKTKAKLCSIILMAFVIWSCNKEDDNPIASKTSTIVSGSNTVIADEQGFDFSATSLVNLQGVPSPGWASRPDLVSQVDIGLSDGGFAASPYVISVDSIRLGSIKDFGVIDFESLNVAPDAGYGKVYLKPIIQNHTYCIITQDNKYAKLRVDQIYKSTPTTNIIDSLSFTWVYQSDGTKNFK